MNRHFLIALLLAPLLAATGNVCVAQLPIRPFGTIEDICIEMDGETDDSRTTHEKVDVQLTSEGAVVDNISFTLVNGGERGFVCRSVYIPGFIVTNDFGEDQIRVITDFSYVIVPDELPEYGYTQPPILPSINEFLRSYSYSDRESALVHPFVVGDRNESGEHDADDLPVYSFVDDVEAFAFGADSSQFPIGQMLLTDESGRVEELPGMSFYHDLEHSVPFANQYLLVKGQGRLYAVPEPRTLGAALTCLLFAVVCRRRATART